MLRFLGVRHLAVIDRLEVEFEPGLNVLTGETGAGKSVLVEAIDLLVGGRASADLVRTGEDVATVQAIFERTDGREVIVRREVSAQGRSRAFIDDALATTAALRELGRDARRSARPARTPGAPRSGRARRRCSTTFAGHDEARGRSSRRDSIAGAPPTARSTRTQLDDREKRARIEIASFQLQEIDQGRAARRRRRRARGGARGARQRRPADPAVGRGLRGALRGRTRGARHARSGVETRRRSRRPRRALRAVPRSA